MDPTFPLTLLTAAGIFFVALLSSIGGQGGATGYLAIMVLYGMPAIIFRPTALALAIVVALISTIRSFRSGLFRWRTFWPLALASTPAVLLAASMNLRPVFYLTLLALVLLYGALRSFLGFGMMNEKKTTVVPLRFALALGAGIGLLAGFAGVGGGIFLSPLLLRMRWAKTKEAFAVAAPFALVNSIIGFSLSNPIMPLMPADLVYWIPAALIGAWIGNEVEVSPGLLVQLNRILSIILVAAALRLIPAII